MRVKDATTEDSDASRGRRKQQRRDRGGGRGSSDIVSDFPTSLDLTSAEAMAEVEALLAPSRRALDEGWHLRAAVEEEWASAPPPCCPLSSSTAMLAECQQAAQPPMYLYRFCAGWVYAGMATVGVSLMERAKRCAMIVVIMAVQAPATFLGKESQRVDALQNERPC